MKTFGTQGRVYPSRHYVVPRTEEKTEFIKRVKEGRYIVLFAPRQTGKTTLILLRGRLNMSFLSSKNVLQTNSAVVNTGNPRNPPSKPQ